MSTILRVDAGHKNAKKIRLEDGSPAMDGTVSIMGQHGEPLGVYHGSAALCSDKCRHSCDLDVTLTTRLLLTRPERCAPQNALERILTSSEALLHASNAGANPSTMTRSVPPASRLWQNRAQPTPMIAVHVCGAGGTEHQDSGQTPDERRSPWISMFVGASVRSAEA